MSDELQPEIESRRHWQGLILIILTSLLWSTSGAFAKSPALAAMDLSVRGPFLACFRTLFAALFILPFAFRKGLAWHPVMAWMLIAFSTMNVTFVSALTHTTAAAAIFLQCTSAFWAPIMSLLFLGESFSRAHKFALIPVLIGILIFVLGDWEGQYLFGNVLALISGIAYAGVVVSLRRLREYDSYYLAFLNHFVSGIILLPWLLQMGISTTNMQWILAACMGVFQMGLPYILFGFGLKSVKASEASLMVLIEPIFNPLWVLLLWGVPILSRDLLGGAFILAGLLLRYLLDFLKPTRPNSSGTELPSA